MEKLFIYGTLKEKEIQRRVFGRIEKGVKDTLEGYRTTRVILDGLIYPILIETPKGSVKGALISVSKDELRLIDNYETKECKRVRVTLKSGKKVWVYTK